MSDSSKVRRIHGAPCRTCNQEKSADPDPWNWIERAFQSPQTEAMEMIVSLAISWGDLEVAA